MMMYAIYSYRYSDEKTLVCYKETEAGARKEIIRLAEEEREKRKNSWLYRIFAGAPPHFTYMPVAF